MDHDTSLTDCDNRVTRPLREILVILRDVVCAVLLFLLACCVAGIFDRYTPFEYPDLYPLWFACGMVPFAFFGHRRGVLTFTWRATLQLAAVVIALSFVPMKLLLPDSLGGTAVFWLVLVGALWLLQWLWAVAFPGHQDSTDEGGAT